MVLQFADRAEAGRCLGDRLLHLRAEGSLVTGDDPVVVGLPRGGVPVAREVARALGAPLDIIVVRKIGVPHQPEVAMGAIGEDNVRVVDTDIMRRAGVTDWEFSRVEAREAAELDRRADRFRRHRRRIPLAGRDVIIVDDGLATGSTMLAACAVARAEGARQVVVAVPVAPREWLERMGEAADQYVCVSTPELFFGVGGSYQDFTQVSDDEVLAALDVDRPASAPVSGGADSATSTELEVVLDVDDVQVGGHLTIPRSPRGLVIFAHGSGSSRHSPRNRYVADVLNHAGHATLLFDLLNPAEEIDRSKVFDIDLLADRLAQVTRWATREPGLERLPIGYFGASTGAAAALKAASEPSSPVEAIVSRGGRPDLAGHSLRDVRAPTLLIVGSRDTVVIGLNKNARTLMRAVCRLEIVPGASHLFEEPGTLATATHLATGWFNAHLRNDEGDRLPNGSESEHLIG